jgi:hypothetical protein
MGVRMDRGGCESIRGNGGMREGKEGSVGMGGY